MRGEEERAYLALVVKNPPANAGEGRDPLGWEDPLEKGMATSPVFWPGEFHGQRSPGRPRGHGVAKSWTQQSNLAWRGRICSFPLKATWLHSPVEVARSFPENIWLPNAHPWDLPQDSFFMGLGTSLVVNFVLVSGRKIRYSCFDMFENSFSSPLTLLHHLNF